MPSPFFGRPQFVQEIYRDTPVCSPDKTKFQDEKRLLTFCILSTNLPPTHCQLEVLKLVFGCKQRNRFREAWGDIDLEWDRTAGGQR